MSDQLKLIAKGFAYPTSGVGPLASSNTGGMLSGGNIATLYTAPTGTSVVIRNSFFTAYANANIGYADLTWTMGTVSGNQYSYYGINNPSVANYVIKSGDTISYQIYWVTSGDEIGMDLYFSNGASLRTTSALFTIGTVGAWQTVTYDLSSFAGLSITTYMITNEADASGTYRAFFREAYILNGGQNRVTIYSNKGPTGTALSVNATATGCPGSTTGSSITTNTGVGATVDNSCTLYYRYSSLAAWNYQSWAQNTLIALQGAAFDTATYIMNPGDQLQVLVYPGFGANPLLPPVNTSNSGSMYETVGLAIYGVLSS